MKKVTFGIVNCNRLFYLKSCLESLLKSTSDYENKEIIVVDNASVEQGTREYLDEKESQGIVVIRNKERDPSNEFARGLNLIVERSTGEFICPLQGDMQFIADTGWLGKYVELLSDESNKVGCVLLDAQRRTRIAASKFSRTNSRLFLYEHPRNPICGAADVFYRREILDLIYPWSVGNSAHEGGGDSETKMLEKCKTIISESFQGDLFCVVPSVSPAVAIYTDGRGTNARIRGNKRYGAYWEALSDDMYYMKINYHDVCEKYLESGLSIPLSIEDLAGPNGDWTMPVDSFGNWKKDPIRPETALESDYVVLYEESSDEVVDEPEKHDYIDDWLKE